MIAVVFLLTLAGSLLLCLAKPRHLKQAAPGIVLSPPQIRIVRSAGFVCVIVAAVIAAADVGVGIGLTLVFGILTVHIIGIAVALPYVERRRVSRAVG